MARNEQAIWPFLTCCFFFESLSPVSVGATAHVVISELQKGHQYAYFSAGASYCSLQILL